MEASQGETDRAGAVGAQGQASLSLQSVGFISHMTDPSLFRTSSESMARRPNLNMTKLK